MSREIYTIDKVRIILKDLEFELISEIYKNNNTNIIYKDKLGYFYFATFKNIKNNKPSRKFHKSNPYTIQNIKLWLILNNKPFELISDIYIKSISKLKWRCLKEKCGEEFENTWNDIQQGSGCGYCIGRKVGLSNCLATKNPNLAKEWHPTKNGDLTPYDVTCGSGKLVWWKCSKNPKHEWEAQILGRKERGCPYCAGHLPSEDYNLLVDNPELCKEWNYEKNDKKPEDYCPHSNDSVWWKCIICGNEWEATIACKNNYEFRTHSCPKCNNNQKGEYSWNWQGGITPEHTQIRQSGDYKSWRIEVYKRDNYTCQCCGDSKGGNLIAHHIENFSEYPELRFDINNGITTCTNCHKPNIFGSFHNIYGTRNNNLKQLIEYYNKYHGDFESPFFNALMENKGGQFDEIIEISRNGD